MSKPNNQINPSIQRLLDSNYTVSVECRENDDVFNNNDLPTYHTPTLDQDSSYKKPDKEQYIFSTMGGGVYSMYSNNMILPIRQKEKLKYSYSLNKRLLDQADQKEGRGIYIVDYYRVASMVAFDPNFLNNIVNFYHTSANLYPEQIEIKNYIVEQLQVNKNLNAFKQPHTVIRIVTFVPEREILKHQHVFIPTSDIVIGYGYIDNKLIHPNSPLYTEKGRVTTSTVKNFIEIDIVDTPTGANRYIKVGNKIVALKATRDYDRKDRGIMTIYKDNVPMQTYEASLDQLGEELGIYTTEREAIYNGDLKLQHEERRMEHDMLRMDHDLRRMDHDKDRLDNDIVKLELDRDMLLKKHEHELRKLELERLINDMKVTSILISNAMDIYKRRFELKTTREGYEAKQQMDLFKHNLETLKLQREMDTYVAKTELDLASMRAKAESNAINTIGSIGKDVLATTSLIGKLLI